MGLCTADGVKCTGIEYFAGRKNTNSVTCQLQQGKVVTSSGKKDKDMEMCYQHTIAPANKGPHPTTTGAPPAVSTAAPPASPTAAPPASTTADPSASSTYNSVGKGGCRNKVGKKLRWEPSYKFIRDKTLQECKDLCTADGAKCTGIEYFAARSAAEINCQLQQGTIVTSSGKAGKGLEECYQKTTAAASTEPAMPAGATVASVAATTDPTTTTTTTSTTTTTTTTAAAIPTTTTTTAATVANATLGNYLLMGKRLHARAVHV